jgi:hypothetical protein
MDWYDALLILSWVVVVVALVFTAGALVGADWRKGWTR